MKMSPNSRLYIKMLTLRAILPRCWFPSSNWPEPPKPIGRAQPASNHHNSWSLYESMAVTFDEITDKINNVVGYVEITCPLVIANPNLHQYQSH